jgi:3-hydroxybutyryl-CoA dehydrogenase
LKPDAIIATNTSSLSVIDIAVATQRSDRVLGFHFFNPAPVMPLIELITTVVTDPEVVQLATDFAERIGKTPVVAKDRAGFVANLLLFPYLNQAAWMVEGGYATKEDVDAAMRAGANLPVGPIEMIDMVGIDTFTAVMETIHEQVADPRYAPRPLLRQLSRAGFLGRKTGRGFYTYEDEGVARTVPDADTLPPADAGSIGRWRRIGIVGTGPLAAGVAEVCARVDFEVVVLGRTREQAEQVAAQVSRSAQRLVERGRLSPERMVAMLQHVHPTIALDDLAECDLVIEAVEEHDGERFEVFAALSETVKPSTMLATAGSATSVIDCAMATARPERVVGLHFFTPAPMMQLVEVVTTVRSDAHVVEQARAFVDRVGKIGVLCGDRAGFIVNTLLFPYLNDAVRMLQSNYATADEIDTAIKLGCGYPMGPFELMDVVGLDVTLAIIEQLREEYRQPSYTPAPLLRNLVDAGFVGRKAGRGFYVYA